MQQVASQLGMFSPIALQFGAYSAYTQAVSTALVLGLVCLTSPGLLRPVPSLPEQRPRSGRGARLGKRGLGPTLLSSVAPS